MRTLLQSCLRLLCITPFTLAPVLAASTETDDSRARDAADLRARINAFSAAFVSADADALEEMLTDDYIHTNTTGSILGKREWLAWIAMRRGEIERGEIAIKRYFNRSVDLRFHGAEAAVVTGINTAEGTRNGERFATHVRFTHLWVKQDGAWRRAAFHDTRLENPPL